MNVQKPAPVWRVGLLLAILVAGLILLNNRQYAFHDELHENGDWAANSLLVRDATHGVLLHGHYSRWNFYHPGPAFLDTLALGEAVFFEWLHVVPGPYNGQFIAIVAAMALFFGLAISVFAARLGAERGGYAFFVPVALLFAVWHYSHAQCGGAFYEAWPAFPPVLTFLCLLVAVASVAAGSGRELPLIALAGGWLVHNHVAQPLFVVPLTLLAYAGFVWSCGQAETVLGPRVRFSALGAGWRAFPRAHLVAAAVLALFILPLFIDALHGSQSNLNRILTHVRTTHEPPKKLLQSFFYFLTFGSYTTYRPGESSLGHGSIRGMLDLIALHWRAYLCWVLTLLVPPILFAVARRPAAQVPGGGGTRSAATAFVGWFYVTLAAAFALTLVWGMKQDGELYYFNSFFDFSIYYAAALGLAASLAVFLQTLTAGAAAARRVLCAALWIGTGVAALDGADLFKAHAADTPGDLAAAHSVTLAAAATLPPGETCYLDCDPWGIWPSTVAVALQLERLGYRVRVNNDWATMFGANRTLAGNSTDLSRPLVRWRIVPMARDPARLGRWPVLMDCGIEVTPLLDIQPDGGRISFAAGGNLTGYALFGWPPPAAGDWTWSDQRDALLQFRPLPLAADANGVDMLINAWSFYKPGSPQAQRVETVFNGVRLETVRLPVEVGTLEMTKVHIDAAVWRDAVARGGAVLQLHFPDAKSPDEIGMNADTRPLSGGFRRIEFKETR